MKAKDYIKRLIKVLASRKDIVWTTYPLSYKKGIFELLKIQSKTITKKDKILLITAGIHGEEIAGPLSLLTYSNKIIDFIHNHGYKVIIYPMNNPSGFEGGTRYNIDNDRGVCGNNDFLRYELVNGKIVDELPSDGKFKKWYRSSDPKLKQKLSLETQVLHKLIKKDPLQQIVASIDLHQDYLVPTRPMCAYHYSFGDLQRYNDIINDIKKYIPVLSKKLVNSGFKLRKNAVTDGQGFIIRHDGSISDLMWRLNIPYTIAVETTGKTPLPLAKRINRLWIKGLVLLLNHEKICGPKKISSSKEKVKKRK